MISFKIKNKFIKNLFSLIFGSGIAQIISILLSPILTRIFSPSDFGVFALYSALFSSLCIIATLRYEQVIVLPEKQEDAEKVFSLCLYVSFTISLLLFIFVLCLSEKIALWLNTPSIETWLYLLPISIFLSGIYQSFNYFNTRSQDFSYIARAQVAQTTSSGLSQLFLGVFQIKGGLVIGQFLGLIIAVIAIQHKLKKNPIKMLHFPKDVLNMALLYKNYPLFSSIGALSNTISAQLPTLIIARSFSESIVGMYGLTMKILTLPMSIIGQAISQVLFQRISVLQREKPENIAQEVIKIFIILILLMLPMVIIIFFWGELLFGFIFGEQWREAGKMASILVFAVAFRFPVSAISSVLLLDKTLKLGVVWQLIYFCTIFITLIFFSGMSWDIFMIAFVLHEVCLSLIYYYFILNGAKILASKI